MHLYRPGRNVMEAASQLVQGNVGGTGDVFFGMLVALLYIKDGHGYFDEFPCQPSEVSDWIGAQPAPTAQRGEISGGGANEPIDADTHQFTLGLGDMLRRLPDHCEWRAPIVEPAEVADERAGQLEAQRPG